jgi:hypothetical protein
MRLWCMHIMTEIQNCMTWFMSQIDENNFVNRITYSEYLSLAPIWVYILILRELRSTELYCAHGRRLRIGANSRRLRFRKRVFE